MPRPRTASDADILEAAFRVIGRVGPANLTLAHVAKEVGLAPATLLQRFGSKRGLLLALAKGAMDSVDDCFAQLRSEHKSPTAALVAGITMMARMTTSRQELANGLAFLQMDLSDPEFHRLALENSKQIHAGYRSLIKEAVTVGELIECDADRLARVVAAVAHGSLVGWAIHGKGAPADWVEADVETVLKPYRRKRGRVSSKNRGR